MPVIECGEGCILHKLYIITLNCAKYVFWRELDDPKRSSNNVELRNESQGPKNSPRVHRRQFRVSGVSKMKSS